MVVPSLRAAKAPVRFFLFRNDGTKWRQAAAILLVCFFLFFNETEASFGQSDEITVKKSPFLTSWCVRNWRAHGSNKQKGAKKSLFSYDGAEESRLFRESGKNLVNEVKLRNRSLAILRAASSSTRGVCDVKDDGKRLFEEAYNEVVSAVHLSHIVTETESMGKELIRMIAEEAYSFEEIASNISACVHTRDRGGTIGWVNLWEASCEALDFFSSFEVLPASVVQDLSRMKRKPGDFALIKSILGWHLIRVNDIFVKMKVVKSSSKKRLPGRGVLSNSGLEALREQLALQNFHRSVFACAEKAGPLVSSPLLQENLSFRPSSAKEFAFSDVFSREKKCAEDMKKRKRYFVNTMGCQMNKADSERISGALTSVGMLETENSKEANVIVLNTCSIRDKAEQKVYSAIGPYAERKRNGESLTIIVAGCVAQQEGERLLRRCPEVDLVMGPQYSNRMIELLEDVANGYQVSATSPTVIMSDVTKPKRTSSVCAWVNIMYGCNERCSYCVVPTTRGIEQSRQREAILEELDLIHELGYKEATLLGQNVDAWGRDMSPKQRFTNLLRYIGKNSSLSRLRFVTSHPRYMVSSVVNAMAEFPAFCEHIHVPFQAGNDRILRAMGRGYTRKRYTEILDSIRSILPGVGLTADAIVGFPGETHDEFKETLALMNDICFDNVFTFAYSPRPNTPAALLPHQISEEEKESRLQEINELNERHALQRNSAYINKNVEILVEDVNKKNPHEVYGRTRTNKLVFFEGDINKLKGEMLTVEVKATRPFSMHGVISRVSPDFI